MNYSEPTAIAEVVYEPPITSPSQTGLVTISNVSLTTTLPDELVTQITREVTKVKLNQTDAQAVIRRYEGACEGVGEILEQIRSIAVTSSDQKDEMAEAHRLRMLLVKKRGIIDAVRSEEKEEAQSRLDFVNGTGRGIRRALEDAEAYAKHQEEFKKREQEARRTARREARSADLAPYLSGVFTEPYGIADMTDEAFAAVLENQKKIHFEKIADDRRAMLVQYQYDGPTDGLAHMSEATWVEFLNVAKITHEGQRVEDLANAARKREARIKQLSEIGMRYAAVADAFTYDEMSVSSVDLTAFDDLRFAETVTKYAATIRERETVKAEARQRSNAEEDKRVARLNQLSALGFTYNAASREYGVHEGSLCVAESTVETLRDDAWSEFLDDLTGKVGDINDAKADAARAARERQEAERQAALAAEALRLAPDKEKLDAYCRSIQEVSAKDPELATEEAKIMYNAFFDELATLINGFATQVNAMAVTKEVLPAGADCPF